MNSLPPVECWNLNRGNSFSWVRLQTKYLARPTLFLWWAFISTTAARLLSKSLGAWQDDDDVRKFMIKKTTHRIRKNCLPLFMFFFLGVFRPPLPCRFFTTFFSFIRSKFKRSKFPYLCFDTKIISQYIIFYKLNK
jgi:hypothetical protein